MATMDDVAKTLGAMAQIYGRGMDQEAAALFASDLEGNDPDQLLSALRSCRRELRTFPTIADILARVQGKDGRPGVEEAWAMIPKDEYGSVVWTNEMATAFGCAGPLLREGDQVGARMAFKEKYLAEVNAARDRGEPVRWTPSFGYDQAQREGAIRAAFQAKRLTQREAELALPHILTTSELAALPAPAPENVVDPAETKNRLRGMLAQIAKPIPGAESIAPDENS